MKEGKSFSFRGNYPSIDGRKALLRALSSIVVGAVVAAIAHYAQLFLSVPDVRIDVTVGLFTASIWLVIINWKFLKENLEFLFVCMAVPIGLALVVLMPFIPEISWDGQIHFAKANCLSYIIDSEFSEADLLMADASAVEQLGLLASGDISSSWLPKQDADTLSAARSMVESLDNSHVLEYSGASSPYGDSYLSVTCFGYIPSAVGLWLGRLFHFSILGRLFIARICQLLFYIAVFFFSIALLKKGKTIVMTLGLLITPLMLAVNFTYDVWGFALTVFSFSYYLGKLQTRSGSIDRFDWFTILFSFLLATFVKAVNFPLAIIFLMTPKMSFHDDSLRRTRDGYVWLVILILIMSFLLPLLFSTATGTEKPDLRGGTTVSPSGQICYVFGAPFTYLGTMFSFTLSFFSRSPSRLFGSYFSYLFVSPTCLGVLSLAIAFGSCYCDNLNLNCLKNTGSWRAVALLCIISAYVLAVSALYAAFTPVGASTVNGFQERYLLPYLVPLLLIVLNPGSRVRVHPLIKRHWNSVWVALEFLYAALYLYFGFISQYYG